jgi:hypothetical protein
VLTDPLHSPIGAILSWEPLRHNASNQATGGIWRVTGEHRTAVLKHATAAGTGTANWPVGTDGDHFNYWKREYLAYTTGAVHDYGTGTAIAAPRLLAAGERPDGSIELWLDEVDGEPADKWTPKRLATFARDLGRAQGRLIDEPVHEWHSTRWLRQYAGRFAYDDVPWDHPVAEAHWDTELRLSLLVLWERRHELFDWAEAMPQTLCHLDVWPANLIGRGDQSILLDWSFIGHGAIGEDIANLIADTFFDGFQPVERLDEVEQTVTESYIEGLAETGYKDERFVRLAIAFTGAAKYCWLAPMMLTNLDAGKSTANANYDDETDNAAVMERRRPIFDMIARWGQTGLNYR